MVRNDEMGRQMWQFCRDCIRLGFDPVLNPPKQLILVTWQWQMSRGFAEVCLFGLVLLNFLFCFVWFVCLLDGLFVCLFVCWSVVSFFFCFFVSFLLVGSQKVDGQGHL